MAQLVERPLPTPEFRGSNSVIAELLMEYLLTYCQLYLKDEKKRRPGMANLKNTSAPLSTKVLACTKSD